MNNTHPTTSHSEHTTAHYINNPFLIATEGITLLFTKAKNVAILFLILSVIFINRSTISAPAAPAQTPAASTPAPAAVNLPPAAIVAIIIAGLIVLVAAFLVAVIVNGMSSYTAAELSKGRNVTISSAFRAVLSEFGSFIALQLLIGVKVFLWSLLLIIPGIIMAVRYSLASVAFFDSDKKLRGNAAIKDSLALTKDAWITTFSAHTLFNVITGGAVQLLVGTGAQAILYRQYEAVRDSNETKPHPHPLAWATFAAILLIILLAVIAAGVFIGWVTSTHPNLMF
jgi:uncharacterized membrane protein